MAPKKNVEQTSALDKNVLSKPPKKRARKEKAEKPNLKTPIILKMKIPAPRKSRKCPKYVLSLVVI